MSRDPTRHTRGVHRVHRARRVVPCLVAAAALQAARARPAYAQSPLPLPVPVLPAPAPQPTPASPVPIVSAPTVGTPVVVEPTQPPVAFPSYRAPALALVQPPPGATVPADRPVVVFRFAQGEPADPIDVASFGVTVDGDDRTPLFQVGAGEAWGPLVPPGAGPNDGARRVAARICSQRGACATAQAVVTLAAPAISRSATGSPSRVRRIGGLLIDATRRLLGP